MEISFEVKNVELSSQIFCKNGILFSISCRTTYKDEGVEFFFVEFPLLSYTEAKIIADKICEGLKPELPKNPKMDLKNFFSRQKRNIGIVLAVFFLVVALFVNFY